MATITYYYSTRSVFTYLGAPTLYKIAARHGATIIHKPVNLSAVIESTGAVPFQDRHPARTAHMQLEMTRWARRRGMAVNVDPVHHFGPREVSSGAVIAAQREAGRQGGDVNALSFAILEALWRDDRDVGAPAVIAALASGCGFDGEALVKRAMEPDIQAEFTANTREGIDRAVMGAPAYFLGDEQFYGQDRLDFLEEALAAR